MKKWRIWPLLLASLLLVSCTAAPESTGKEGVDQSGPDTDATVVESYIFFAPTREQFMMDVDGVVTVTVENAMAKSMDGNPSPDEEELEEVYLSTNTVGHVLRGDFRSGQKIKVVQLGNNKNIVYSDVINSGGYLEKGVSYLLFLSKRIDESGDTFYVPSNAGQLKIDQEGNIIGKTEWSNRYWEEADTVDDMQALLDSLVLPTTTQTK